MRRTLVALSLAASLVTTAPSNLLHRFWELLSAFSGDSPPAHLSQTKDGCHADPDGRCLPVSQPQTKDGCHADPDGLCKP